LSDIEHLVPNDAIRAIQLRRTLLEEEQDNEQDWRRPEHRYGDEIPKIIFH
jgi:hypothetical protein